MQKYAVDTHPPFKTVCKPKLPAIPPSSPPRWCGFTFGIFWWKYNSWLWLRSKFFFLEILSEVCFNMCPVRYNFRTVISALSNDHKCIASYSLTQLSHWRDMILNLLFNTLFCRIIINLFHSNFRILSRPLLKMETDDFPMHNLLYKNCFVQAQCYKGIIQVISKCRSHLIFLIVNFAIIAVNNEFERSLIFFNAKIMKTRRKC